MNYYHIDDSVRKGYTEGSNNKKKQKYCFHNSIERVQNRNIYIILPFWYITYIYI